MSSIREDARKFWCAAFYIRRGQDRDKSIALKVLQHITQTATGTVQSRATEILKDHDGE